MALTPGTRFGPYEIVAPLGAGGMGEVYRAADVRLDREVAIKVLPDELSDIASFTRLEREARAASALSHPNIVTIHELGRSGEVPYIAMELVRGDSLRSLMKRRVAPRRALALGAQIADALAAAHGAGIVHRDLKPENVMVTPEGRVKVLDFGIARRDGTVVATEARTEIALTGTGTLIGTAAYMAPEQARGEPVDFRADQFALGVILWEMMAGRHPFLRATTAATLGAIAEEEEDDLARFAPVSPEIATIVARCLRKDPAARYGATSDLAHDLRRASEAPAAPRRRVSGALVAALGLATAAALLGAFAVGRATRRATVPDAPPMRAALDLGGIGVTLGESWSPLALSPDGRSLVVNPPRAAGSGLWIHDLETGESRPLEGTENGSSPEWSDDGRELLFFAEGKLRAMSLDGSPPRVIGEASLEGSPAARGGMVLYAQALGEPSVWKVPLAGGDAVRVVPPRGGRVPFWPEFLPDGRRFLFLDIVPLDRGKGRKHELMVGSIDGDAPAKVADLDSRVQFVDGFLLYVRDGTLLAHPFDPERLRFTGEPVPLASGVHYFYSTGLAAFGATPRAIVWRGAPRPTELTWVDRAGTVERVVGTEHFEGGRLTADGRTYATAIRDAKQGTADLWMWDVERGSGVRALVDVFDSKSPLLLPDGRMLYRSDGDGPPDVFVTRPGGAERERFLAMVGVEAPVDVTPDGRLVLVESYSRATAGDLWIVPADDPSGARPLLRTPADEASPRVSPDGRWIAHASNESGRHEVYVRPLEGNAAPVRVSTDGGVAPRWRDDGAELFYLGVDGAFMAVPVATAGPAIRLGTPSLLFRLPNVIEFDVAPGGERFLVHRGSATSAPPVRVLTNWQQLARR